MPEYIKYAVSGLLATALLVVIAGCLWMLQTYPVEQDVIERALLPDTAMDITREPYLVFRPAGEPGDRGLIFFPGGKSAITAYAPVLRRLAEAGLLVVAVPMPLNFPLLGACKASRVMEEFPAINRWYLAGHSLGGVAATRYARDHGERLAGLVLWASYPNSDITEIPLDVLLIYARGDLHTTPQDIVSSRQHLPATAVYQEIEGNHWQFGHFSKTLNQRTPAVSREQQQTAITRATLAFIGLEQGKPRGE